MATVLALVFDIVPTRTSSPDRLRVRPLYATFIVDFLGAAGAGTSARTPGRWMMVVPWAAFVTYQLINPGTVGWWQRWWLARQHDLHLTPPSWLGATGASFVVAAVLALLIGKLSDS